MFPHLKRDKLLHYWHIKLCCSITNLTAQLLNTLLKLYFGLLYISTLTRRKYGYSKLVFHKSLLVFSSPLQTPFCLCVNFMKSNR